MTVGEASRLIKGRKLSPVELTRAFLERIQVVDRRVKSYVTLVPDSAISEARVAEAEIFRGKYRGPLHGIPLALKDNFDTKGVRTTAQSKVLEHRVPSDDATVVTRLREAGAVLLGKLAMHEFAVGGPQTSLFEPARNPWNPNHFTGGSSSGSGAAVAAGLCMGALGSDTGGSIRQPASLCGIVGLKPTYGLVSRYGVIPLSWSLDCCGPMTRTVEDTAFILQAIAGYDPQDPTTALASVPDYSAFLKKGIAGLRIGIPRRYFFDTSNGVGQETVAAVDKALADLGELGAGVEEVNIPSLEYAGMARDVIIRSESFNYHKENLRSQPENFGDIARLRLYVGVLFTASDYVQAQRARSRVKREFAQVLQKVDVIATPTELNPAPTFQEFDPVSKALNRSLTGAFSLTGMPAISLPCGFSHSGLPIGLQIAGKPFDEPTVLRVAYAYEQRVRWYERRPPL